METENTACRNALFVNDMAKWMVAAKKADFDQIAEKYHITPVLARIMRNRDVVGDEEIKKFLHGDLQDLNNPFLMKELEQAAEIILKKIREEKLRENSRFQIFISYIF